MQNQYLYHYGVQGMRWGVRKTPEERLKRYTNREIALIARRRARQVNREDKQIERRRLKVNAALDKEGGSTDSRRQTKAASKYIKTKAKSTYRDALAFKEIDKLTNMKYEDMQSEKRAVGKALVKSVLATAGAQTISAVAGLPVTMVFYPKVKNVKTNSRVDAATRTELYTQEYGRAADEVYKKRD